MTAFAHMSIAGVNFVIDRSETLPLQGTSPAYRSFFGQTAGPPAAIEVKVDLDLTPLPEINPLARIFEAGAWSMFRENGHYLLALNSAVSGRPRQLARFDHEVNRVAVYYGPSSASHKAGQTWLSNPITYPLDQLLLMYILARREGALVHGAGMAIQGRGFIFPGRSGAGKSTLSRQFAGRPGVERLSDDRMIVRKIEGGWQAFGTPWPGTERIAVNGSAPLAGIFFIYHAPANRVVALNPQQALERLLPVTSIPWYDREIVPAILSFYEELVAQVPAYELHFKPTVEVAGFLEKFVAG
jgi:hypothetical protein